MKKYLVTACLIFVGFLAGVAPLLAEQKDPLGLNYGNQTGLGNYDVRITVARIINVVLGLLGTIALVIIIYAGFLWMTAGGSEDKSEKARGILFAAVIGLAIILSAYAITRFVVENLYEATTGNTYFK